jgi:hypothetical protein
MTISEYLKNAKFVKGSILDQTERIVLAKENEIVNLNIDQIENSKGADDKELKNSNSKFKGVYTLATQMINPEKIAGNPYTFRDSGNFLNNFQVDIMPDLTKITIFSTGTGSNQKANFFKGYSNIFGLTKQNQYEMNYRIIKPELMKFINQYL